MDTAFSRLVDPIDGHLLWRYYDHPTLPVGALEAFVRCLGMTFSMSFPNASSVFFRTLRGLVMQTSQSYEALSAFRKGMRMLRFVLGNPMRLVSELHHQAHRERYDGSPLLDVVLMSFGRRD